MKVLTYKSVDIMKKTKDSVTNQLTTAEKWDLIMAISETGATHISISVPMDTDAQFRARGITPGPRTIENETKEWCDLIHAAGMKVLHRGPFCGQEAIYNFPYFKYGSTDFIAAGTASTAASDGETTWCGRVRRYIVNNVGQTHWQSGDVFAPMPEATTHAFDGNMWVSSAGSGLQANFYEAFKQFKLTADAVFATWGLSVTFMSHNNFSEVASGWIPGQLFTDQNVTGADYYGQYRGSGVVKPGDYVIDVEGVYSSKGKPFFYGEWGDIKGEAIPAVSNIQERLAYLRQFYNAHRDYVVNNGKMIGFNYWGGWEGQNTSILYKDSNGKYKLNARGIILKNYFRNGDCPRTPVTTTEQESNL